MPVTPGRRGDSEPARDKTSLDVFRLKDKSPVDLDNLPEPDELAEQIIENLEAGLESFREVLAGVSEPDRLAAVGEAIIDCDTSTELLAAAERIVGATN